MIKSKKVIIITLFVALFIIVAGLGVFFLTGESVETAEEASAISQEYISRRYGDKYSEDVISDVYLEENIWVVAYRNASDEAIYMAGGGSPKVYINQNNDRLIWCLLQK